MEIVYYNHHEFDDSLHDYFEAIVLSNLIIKISAFRQDYDTIFFLDFEINFREHQLVP